MPVALELNGYLIGKNKKLEDILKDEFLHRFPIIYKRMGTSTLPRLQINKEAQELF